MDFDTTGIEPDTALVKYKLLAGGGTLKMVNQAVPFALDRLGYSEEQKKSILYYINENETIEGSELKEEHLPVFDCALKPANGKRSISPQGHINMMAAAQPFLSGAISKTINMDEDTTIEEIKQTYIDAWKKGLKAVAIYRYGSKQRQPVSVSKTNVKGLEKKLEPIRRRLPNTRNSITHKFAISPSFDEREAHEGYLTVGLFEDDAPGELFINMAKEGSTVGGLMDVIGTLTSMSLQYGVPVKTLSNKFKHQKFDPRGFVLAGAKELGIHTADSIIDYIFNWMEKKFDGGNKDDEEKNKKQSETIKVNSSGENNPQKKDDKKLIGERGGFCIKCQSQMIKFGHCEERCPNPNCNHIEYSGCGK